MIRIFTDGGSRGNPGPAAYGVFMCDDNDTELAALSRYIGEATNNVAEYSGVVAALEHILAHPKLVENEDKILFFLDSELAVKQLNGLYKIKNGTLAALVIKIRGLEAQLSIPVVYSHIPREKNSKADALVNRALDSEKNLSYNKMS